MNAQRWAFRLLGWMAPAMALGCVLLQVAPATAQDAPAAPQGSPVWIGAPAQVTGGFYHMCARSVDGAILCWGANYYGQLGDGSHIDHAAPVVTRPLSGAATDLATGHHHNCAVTTHGQVMCWGFNFFGQVGDGTDVDRAAPVGVAGLTSGYQQVTAGRYFSCALSAAGAVRCWGANDRYQLGDGTTISHTTPVTVISSGVSAIAAGDDHACALTDGGAVKCWGTIFMTYKLQPDDPNYHSTSWQAPTPTTIGGLPPDISAIAAGSSNACAITGGGGLKCWGDNYQGTLGTGAIADTSTINPTDVVGMASGTQAVVLDGYNVCALTSGGAVRCWGFGAIGNGTQGPQLTPAEVTGLSSGVSSIGAGSSVACAVIVGGSLQCWGSTVTGALGAGNAVDFQRTPVYVLWPGRTYTFAISGRVLAEGAPVAGATVTAGYNAAATDNNGVYTLTTLSAGGYRVSIRKAQYTFEPPARTVAGPPSRVGIDFAAHPLVPPLPPQPAQPPLLIVHGIQTFAWPGKRCSEGVLRLRTALDQGADYTAITTLGELPRWFLDGYDVWMAHLTSSAAGTPSLYTNAACLAAQIDQVYAQTGKKITIVAHSMGGVVTRACLAQPACRSKVATVYTLGTPHAGIAWGFAAKVLLGVAEGVARANGIPAPIVAAVCAWQSGFCDLGSDSMALFFNSNPANRNQPGIRYAFIGGDKTPGAGGAFLWLFDGRNDGAVGRASAVGWVHPFKRPLPSNWMAPAPPVQYWTNEVHNGMFAADGYPYESPRYGGPSIGFHCVAYLEGRRSTLPAECRPVTGVTAAADGEEITTPAQTTPVLAGSIQAGATVTHLLTIDATGATQFLVAWDVGTLDIRLVRPDGQEITPAFADSAPETVAYVADLNDEASYNLAGYVFTTTLPGVWGVWIHGVDTLPEGATYSLLAAMRSDRQLAIGVDKPLYAAGETVVVTATLTNHAANGAQGMAGATVEAAIATPDGVTTTLTLVDLGGGAYQGSFVTPAAGGQGMVTVVASGVDDGSPFTRQADLLFAVASATATFGSSHHDQGIDDDADGAFEALAVDVVLQVSTPATFTVAAELIADGASLGATATTLTVTTPGAQIARLSFDAPQLTTCQPGPYTVANAYLIDHAAGVVPADIEATLHTTAAYACEQFAAARVFLPAVTR